MRKPVEVTGADARNVPVGCMLHAGSANHKVRQAQTVNAEHRSGSDGYSSLRLYVAGNTSGALRALANRKRLIQASDGRIEIQIIDILVNPEEAERAGIIATPTLSDDSVDPPRRLIGDIGNIADVLSYFGYPRKDAVL